MSDTAARIDGVLSQVAFLQYVIIISDLSKYVYYLISRFKFSHENFLELFFVIFRVSHMLWLFFFISISASRVTEESNASLRRFHHLTIVADVNGSASSQEVAEYVYHSQLLLVQMSAPSVVLSGWNMFNISRSFILTVLGAVLTYTIILFQITPWTSIPASEGT